MWLNSDDKLVCVYIAVQSALQCTFYVNPDLGFYSGLTQKVLCSALCTAMYTHTSLSFKITHIRTYCLMWTSGKRRGFCIITNRDSVLLDQRLPLEIVFLCFSVQEFQGFIVASSPSARLGRQWEPLCSTHLCCFRYRCSG